MAFSLVAHTKGAQGSSTTTPAIDTTGANLIVVSIGTFGGFILSDSKSNTWTALTTRTGGAFATVIYYCLSPTVGSGHTFTLSSGFPTVCVTAWSGAATSSVFDVENGAGSTAVTSIATGSVTPANANSLVIASIGAADNSTGPVAISGGFTISDQGFGNSGVTESGAQAYLIQTSAAAANPTWSSFSSSDAGAAIAVFKAAAGGSPDITLALTGSAATTASGTLGKASLLTLALTGIAATAGIGTLTPARSVALAGITSTASPGTLGGFSLITIGLTGSAATGAAGSVSVGGDKTIALTGSSATAFAGTLASAFSTALTGQGLTASPGTLGRTSLVTIALTGISAISAAGTMTASGGTPPAIWTPVVPDATSWTPTTDDSQIWTPVIPGSSTWTPQ